MRLPNGYGSIVKLSGNRRNPYGVRITTGFTYDGKQQRKFIGYFPKRAEALAALAEYNERPYNLDARNFTFQDVWYQVCKTRYKNDNGRADNRSYNAAFKHCANWYSLNFFDIRTPDLQAMIDSLPTWAQKKALRIVLNKMYKLALENDWVYKNYASYIVMPPEPPSNMHNPFTPDELQIMFNRADEHLGIKMVLILCYSGMRPSELLNTEKENVHLEERYIIGGMKTTSGKNRYIPIAEKIFPFIKEFYNMAASNYLISPPGERAHMSYDRFNTNYLHPAMNILGFKHLGHDGRHTCATLLDNAGVNNIIKKKILGHSTKDITEKVYTHKTIDQLIEAINLI